MVDTIAPASGAAAVRPPHGPFYEVGFEAQLDPGRHYPGISAQRHFQEANRQLYEFFKANPVYADFMESLYPGIKKGVAPGTKGAFSRKPPTPDVTWHHHATREGTLQLVPRSHHRAAGVVQDSLHPDGRGGMENWGGGRKVKGSQ